MERQRSGDILATVHAGQSAAMLPAGTKRWRSHFASCPNADCHRKPRQLELLAPNAARDRSGDR